MRSSCSSRMMLCNICTLEGVRSSRSLSYVLLECRLLRQCFCISIDLLPELVWTWIYHYSFVGKKLSIGSSSSFLSDCVYSSNEGARCVVWMVEDVWPRFLKINFASRFFAFPPNFVPSRRNVLHESSTLCSRRSTDSFQNHSQSGSILCHSWKLRNISKVSLHECEYLSNCRLSKICCRPPVSEVSPRVLHCGKTVGVAVSRNVGERAQTVLLGTDQSSEIGWLGCSQPMALSASRWLWSRFCERMSSLPNVNTEYLSF